MKKRLISGIVAFAMIISCITMNVNAADGTISITPSKTELNPGETFTVTISGNSDEGINGLEAVITYDEAKLELVESKVVDKKWIDLGQNVDEGVGISIMCNSTDKITSANIYVLTFKVKTNITDATTIKITMSGAKLYTDASQTYDGETKEVPVSILIPTNTDGGNNGSGSQGTTDGGNNGNGSQGTTDSGNDGSGSQGTTDGENNESGSQGTTDSENNGSGNQETTDTYNKTKLPKTGESDYLIIVGVVFVLFGIASFIGYRKYREI